MPQVTLPTNVTAPSATWTNITGNLAGLPSVCGNLTLVAADPWSARIIAGVGSNGLYAKDTVGGSWTKLGSGSGSADINNRPAAITFDPDDPNTFWEAGSYGHGVFVTRNRGATFTRLGNIENNDTISVDMYDPNRNTLLAGVHENSQTVLRSTDGGATWTNVGANLPAGTNHSPSALVISSTSHLVGVCGYLSAPCGVWRTSNGGTTWTATLSSTNAAGTPLWHSNGRIYWPQWNGGLAVSEDTGVTWMNAANVRFPVELPDGRLLALQGANIAVSSDGINFTAVGQQVPIDVKGLAYSAWTKTMYIWANDCGTTVPSNAVYSAGFNWQP
jgi:hypothetical protein